MPIDREMNTPFAQGRKFDLLHGIDVEPFAGDVEFILLPKAIDAGHHRKIIPGLSWISLGIWDFFRTNARVAAL